MNNIEKYTLQIVKNILNETNCTILLDTEFNKDDIYHFDSVVNYIDSNGYKYSQKLKTILNRNNKKQIVGKNNKFSIYNINHFLELYHIPFLCISKEYISATTDLTFKCNRCGNLVNIKWNNVNHIDNTNRHHIICNNCDGRTESLHALVLKQVFKYNYSDTIEEDLSCVNPITNKIMPTDIVNHRLKIAIEIQSQWHDTKAAKEKDAYKKQFWINKGYHFYDPDIRNYSVLEMVQLFFPNIQVLPDYIDYNYSNKINIKNAQQLLNSGLSVSETANKLAINKHRIYDAIYSGKLYYPKNYIQPDLSPVVQLDIYGNFINEYESISKAANANNINGQAISRALSKNRHYSGGYYWYYKNNYEPSKISIQSRFSKFYIPVDKYDKHGTFICSYKTIIDASKDNNISNSQIYKVITGELKQTGGYIYKKSI